MQFLYFDVIAVSCGSFLVLQIYRSYTLKSWKGWGYLAAAGISGGVGLVAIYESCFMCAHVSVAR